jgi:hypothetical protein
MPIFRVTRTAATDIEAESYDEALIWPTLPTTGAE